MKINYLKMSAFAVIAASTLFLGSCSKDEDTKDNPGGGGAPASNVAKVQNAVVFSFTGTWCGPCGLYGKPALKDLEATYKEKAVVISCQASDEYTVTAGQQLQGFFKATSIPTAGVGGNEKPFSMLVGGVKVQEVKTKAAELIALSPIAGSHITKKVDGSKLVINVETEFFQSVNGEYYLAVYVLEDNIIGRQNVSGQGYVTDVEFDNILRFNTESQPYGALLENGSIDANKKFNKEYTVNIDSKWKAENLKVATVIWKKGSTGFSVCNGAVK